jgi:hypothetical protein
VIAHWDGRRLHVAHAFRPSGRSGELTGIAALSRSNLWAVGTVAKRPLVEHWNGRHWNADGSGVTRLRVVSRVHGDISWYHPTWAPDRKRLALAGYFDNGSLVGDIRLLYTDPRREHEGPYQRGADEHKRRFVVARWHTARLQRRR